MKIIDIDELDDFDDITQTETEDKVEELEEVTTQVDSVEENSRKKLILSISKEIISFVLSIAVVLVLTFLLVRYVGQRTEVNGSSMEYTLFDRDNLIVDKITYRFSDPKRFDIIVFPYPSYPNSKTESIYYIKRIIGLPGETVQITEGVIYINGEELKESYGKEVMRDAKRAVDPIKLGEDEYFVLGDNRNHSSDSREIGNIKKDKIVGRAWIRIWPFNRIGLLKHQ